MFSVKVKYLRMIINHYFRYWRKKKNGEKYLKQIIFNKLGYNVKNFNGNIYVLGDSHSGFWGGDESLNFIPFVNDINVTRNIYPIFKVFHLNPVLAFNLNRRNTQNRGLEKTEFLINSKIIPPKSRLMLCFGEIDIRVHILKQAEMQQISLEQSCDAVLKNYLEYIKMLQSKGFKIICWGPIATCKNEWSNSVEFPAYGSEADRNKITEIFNNKLEILANENNFYYCSIFKHIINDDYTTKDNVIFDGCHLAKHNMELAIKELFNKKLLVITEGGRVKWGF